MPIHRPVGVRESVRGTLEECARAWCRRACRGWPQVAAQRPLPKGQRWHLNCPQWLWYDFLCYGEVRNRVPTSAGVFCSMVLLVRPGRRGWVDWSGYVIKLGYRDCLRYFKVLPHTRTARRRSSRSKTSLRQLSPRWPWWRRVVAAEVAGGRCELRVCLAGREQGLKASSQRGCHFVTDRRSLMTCPGGGVAAVRADL